MSKAPPITASRIAAVFRTLANQHAARRSSADSERSWERIVHRTSLPSRAAHQSKARLAQWTLAAALAACVAIAWVLLSSDRMSYELRGAVASDGTIQTGPRAAVLDFSDASRIDISAFSTLAVSVVGEQSALVRLSDGRILAKVTSSEDADWRFLAGPYEVRVVGTEFELAWDRQAHRLTLQMREGRVHVLGPEARAVTVSAGERLTLPAEPSTAQVTAAPLAPAGSTPPRSEAVLENEAASPLRPAETRGRVAAARSSAISSVEAPEWPALVAQGYFERVVRSARAEGIDNALANRNSDDLRALAQAARYAGHVDLAMRAWTAIRQRFPAIRAGKEAAFFLGRIYDELGQSSQALRWLNTYNAESPGAIYASDALGRTMVITRKQNGARQASHLARDYLRRFPSGSYARTARELLTLE